MRGLYEIILEVVGLIVVHCLMLKTLHACHILISGGR